MKARYKVGLIILGLLIILWVMMTDNARIEYGDRLEIIEKAKIEYGDRLEAIENQVGSLTAYFCKSK